MKMTTLLTPVLTAGLLTACGYPGGPVSRTVHTYTTTSQAVSTTTRTGSGVSRTVRRVSAPVVRRSVTPVARTYTPAVRRSSGPVARTYTPVVRRSYTRSSAPTVQRSVQSYTPVVRSAAPVIRIRRTVAHTGPYLRSSGRTYISPSRYAGSSSPYSSSVTTTPATKVTVPSVISTPTSQVTVPSTITTPATKTYTPSRVIQQPRRYTPPVVPSRPMRTSYMPTYNNGSSSRFAPSSATISRRTTKMYTPPVVSPRPIRRSYTPAYNSGSSSRFVPSTISRRVTETYTSSVIRPRSTSKKYVSTPRYNSDDYCPPPLPDPAPESDDCPPDPYCP